MTSSGLLPVHPGDFELLGFSFDNRFYVDRALSMGCSIYCVAFEHFRFFLEWVMKERSGVASVVH